MSDLRPPLEGPPDAPDLQDTLMEDSPLREADPMALEELLDRVNDYLIAGTPARIRENDDELLIKMVEGFREEAREWVQKEKDKPRRGTGRKSKEIDMSQALDL